MKTLKKDLKNGVVKVMTETPDDLWHLEKLLEVGDIVTGKTFRKVSIKKGSEIVEGDREPVTLSLELEKVEYHKDSHKLRLTGPIKSGPEDRVQIGSYHTISVGLRDILSVKKLGWKKHQLERLEKAKIKPSLLLVCVLDRDEADFAELKESGIEHLASIRSRKGKDGEIEGYHSEVLEYLQRKARADVIVIAGPGFERENLKKFIDEKDPGLGKRIFLEHCHSTGKTGINEVIKRSANRILKESRIVREAEAVEILMERIQTEGLAVYGKKETKQAVDSGAVETLLVSEEKIKDFENLMDLTEKMRGSVRIISSDHEAGERFLSLGGIAGLLRFRV
jgi:protein pelota